MIVEKDTTECEPISNSVENFKNTHFTTSRCIDTLLLTIKTGKNTGKKLRDIVSPFCYKFRFPEIMKYKDNGYTIHVVNTGSTRIEIRGINSYGYITVLIYSLEKLERDVNIKIRHAQPHFANDIKKKILGELFIEEFSMNKIKVKKCDLAFDLRFPEIKGERFHTFCRKLTRTTLNLHFSYLKAEKDRSLNTGYFKTIKGENKRIRFYNKDLKERKNGVINPNYESTYRIEYIFEDYDIKTYMNGKKIKEISIHDGFERMFQRLEKAFIKYEDKVDELVTGNFAKQGKRMFDKYAYSSSGENLYDESWQFVVNVDQLFKGRPSVFGNRERYYQKRMIHQNSYGKLLIDNSLIKYFYLFDDIIFQLRNN